MTKLNLISRSKYVFPDMESGAINLLLWLIAVISVHTDISLSILSN